MSPAPSKSMPLIRPFAGLRPAPGYAAQVAAPPYDTLTTEEARERAAATPWSFLHLSKPEIDFPPGTDPYAPQVYAKAAENLKRMMAADVLMRDRSPCYYAYRLEMGGHSQTGLVATVSVAEYDRNRIRCHELTRPDKEDDRLRQIEALNAQTGPALIAYPAAPQVDALLAQASAGVHDTVLTAADGIRHTIWIVREPGLIERLTRAFDAVPAFYIADGHHRSAAASRVAAARRALNARHTAEENYEYFLAVIFPHHQLRVLDYNRVVADLNGLNDRVFLERVGERFSVRSSPIPVKPSKHGEFGLYLRGRWYALDIRPESLATEDPIARLDVSLLSNHLLGPVLGIHDLRQDKRIDFVGGMRGLSELERRVDSGEMAAAFSLFPTRMEDLMSVADAGQILPPKSTWFEPKLADGLVSHVLD